SRLVADAVSARRAFLTLGLRAARENDPAAFARTGNRPTITVALKPPPVPPVPRPPAAPAEVAADPGGACASGPARPTIGTLRPTLSAKISDPDSRLVGARFEWRSLSGPVFGGQTTPMQASGTRLSVVVPDGALADGYGYAWRVQGLDGKASGPWSAWCEFTVGLPAALPDPEQPPARPGQPGPPRELGTGGNGWLGTCGQGAARSWIRELAPAFSATLDDPDYQPDDDGIYDPPVPLRATFEWVRLDGTKIGEKDVDGYARDRFRAWTPSGQFEDGQTYAWHVRASDETGPGPWSPWCEFTVDVTPPQTPPTVTSKEFPNDQAWHDRVGVTGTFTLNAGNDPDVVKFRYELDGRTATVPADRPGGTASITFTPTRGGPYFLRVYAVDRAGASGDPVTYEFRVSG
ncbi:MAG TPA: hypothetical protein VHJ17_07400, partial [Thermomonospora sp.]|nr:hypothetical protein [Thermomonospora sp.]